MGSDPPGEGNIVSFEGYIFCDGEKQILELVDAGKDPVGFRDKYLEFQTTPNELGQPICGHNRIDVMYVLSVKPTNTFRLPMQDIPQRGWILHLVRRYTLPGVGHVFDSSTSVHLLWNRSVRPGEDTTRPAAKLPKACITGNCG